MANRSYLYSLSNRPESYSDKPESITGLSEWAHETPFSYRVLMSGNPQLCSSLIFDGFEHEPTNLKSRLFGISSVFDDGLNRLRKFLGVVNEIAADGYPCLVSESIETLKFLDAHRNEFLLLETSEIDGLKEDSISGLRACVEKEISRCLAVGDAVDLLPNDPVEATQHLKEALIDESSQFFGLRLDKEFDNVRFGKTNYPLGLSYWDEEVYFQPAIQSDFESRENGSDLKSESTHFPGFEGIKEIEFCGEVFQRIAFGEEPDAENCPTQCIDCGATKGKIHKFGCSQEQCPRCKGRFASCGCHSVDKFIRDAKSMANSPPTLTEIDSNQQSFEF